MKFLGVIVLAVLCTMCDLQPVSGKKLVVDDFSDAFPIAAPGTLRDQLGKAHDGDTIVFDGTGPILIVNSFVIDSAVTIMTTGMGQVLFDCAAVPMGVSGIYVTATGFLQMWGIILKFCDATNGAINNAGGTVKMVNCLLEDNRAVNGGAYYTVGGTTVLGNVSMLKNVATGFGGAIYNDAGAMNIFNTTISDNDAAQSGGGILAINFHSIFLESVTIALNTSGLYGGGIYNSGPTITATNTIMGTNVAAFGDHDMYGSLTSNNNNLIQAHPSPNLTIFGTITNNIYGLDPLLLPLKDNGYGMICHDLQPLSPALDAGRWTGNLQSDQRGAPRRLDGEPNGSKLVDIGAVEHSPLCVTNTSDNLVAGSLRSVLTMANVQPGSDYICFSIPGAGPHTIVVNAGSNGPLPLITDTVIIDGYSQDNSQIAFGTTAASLQVEITSSGMSGLVNGLTLVAGSNASVVKGLAIGGFPNNGIGLEAVSDVVIAGNHIGTDIAGLSNAGNGNSGISISLGSTGNIIGGSADRDRNVLSGNSINGILVDASSDNIMLGNYIGIASDGGIDLSNSGNGILLRNGSNSNTIGGTVAGEQNTIGNNAAAGISIRDVGSSFNTVWGNIVGMDIERTASHPNGVGIELSNAPNNTIGGAMGSGAQNYISGNTDYGVLIEGFNAVDNEVFGNIVGPFAGFVVGVGTLQVGIGVRNFASLNTIGSPGDYGNLISGNSIGIEFNNVSLDNLVYNNKIGTDTSGLFRRANGKGIVVSNSSNQIIGSDRTAGMGNLISGNTSHGIEFNGGGSGNSVEGNTIGADRAGLNANGIGNGGHGIYINGQSSLIVGGTGVGVANTIAYNGVSGISVVNGNANQFVRNSIYLNTQLGIDLNADGTTANDPLDSDAGPNDLQNYPVLNAPSNCGGVCNISGYIDTEASASYIIEFYHIPAARLDGTFGEGPIYIGEVTVLTDGAGHADFLYVHPANLPITDYISCSASKVGGSTSEFARSARILPAMQLSTSISQLVCGLVTGGSASVVVTAGGTGPFSYLWDAGTGYQTNDTAYALNAGNYSVAITDINGCVDSVSVSLVPSLVMPGAPTLSGGGDYCKGASAAPLVANYSGTGSVAWFDHRSLTTVIGTGTNYNPSTSIIGSKWYYAAVYAGTCQGPPDSVEVVIKTVPSAPSGSIKTYTYCEGDSYEEIAITPASTGIISWYMIGGHSGVLANGTTLTPTIAPATYYARESLDGCTGPSFVVTVDQYPTEEIVVSESISICPGEEATLSISGGVSQLWSGDETISEATSSNPTVTPTNSTEYSVSVMDANKCKYSASVYVEVRPEGECGFHIYNAFSPNNDNTNDAWVIDGIEGRGPNWVGIYNRWGDLLIEFKEYDNQTVVWDGTSRNGDMLPSATYFYVVELKDTNQSYNGWVQLTR